MSRKTFSLSGYLAVGLLLGFSTGLKAQVPDKNTWNTGISFSGNGSLDLATSGDTGTYPISVGMTGTGQYTANNGLPYDLNSFFNVIITATVPNTVSPSVSPFSITQPITGGADPGLHLTTPTTSAFGDDPDSLPFYGLFPAPPGTVYSANNSLSRSNLFQFDPSTTSSTRNVAFNGAVTLTLGDDPIETATPDSSGNGQYDYSFSYANSDLQLTYTLGGADPEADFIGTVVITTVAGAPAPDNGGGSDAVPDSSTGIFGLLVVAGLCLAGGRHKARAA